jgi:hypothetical protein
LEFEKYGFLCSPLLCVVASVVGVFIWSRVLSSPSQHEYTACVLVYALCACIESTAEPLWIIGQQMHLDRFIVSFEIFWKFLGKKTFF